MDAKFNIDEYRLEGLWKIFAEKLEFDTKDMEQRPAYYETVKQAFKYGILTFYGQVLMSPVLYQDENLYMAVLELLNTDGEIFLAEQQLKKMMAQN